MTNIDSTGKIITSQPQTAPVQGQVLPVAPLQVKPVAAVSKVTHILAAILASIAAFALTPAGQSLIAQYPHLAVVSGLVATLASLYKTPQAD